MKERESKNRKIGAIPIATQQALGPHIAERLDAALGTTLVSQEFWERIYEIGERIPNSKALPGVCKTTDWQMFEMFWHTCLSYKPDLSLLQIIYGDEWEIPEEWEVFLGWLRQIPEKYYFSLYCLIYGSGLFTAQLSRSYGYFTRTRDAYRGRKAAHILPEDRDRYAGLNATVRSQRLVHRKGATEEDVKFWTARAAALNTPDSLFSRPIHEMTDAEFWLSRSRTWSIQKGAEICLELDVSLHWLLNLTANTALYTDDGRLDLLLGAYTALGPHGRERLLMTVQAMTRALKEAQTDG